MLLAKQKHWFKGKRGLTSVSLNELVRYKNAVLLAAYSGLRLGKRQKKGEKEEGD